MSTVALERPATSFNEVGSIILPEWRQFVHDRSRVEHLEQTYPYLVHRLGTVGANAYLFTAFDNDTGAFKWRGSFNAVAEAVDAGATAISAGSAGNHATGVAAAGAYFDVPTYIFVSKQASETKVARSRAYGAHVTRLGNSVEDAISAAQEHPDAYFAHAYNNRAVMAGQGSMVDDILRTDPDTDTIALAAGGGGMAGGIADRLTQLGRDDIHLVAVVAEGATSLRRSLSLQNEPVNSARVPVEYSGAAVRKIGSLPLQSLLEYPNLEIVTMHRDEVERVVAELLEQNVDLDRGAVTNLEPTSQLAVAALQRATTAWGKTVVIGSGENEPADTILGRHKLQQRRLYI